jgi:hypothetical protein
MMIFRGWLAMCLCSSVWAAQPAVEPVANKVLISAHMHFLADDLLEGREAGSRGFDVAALYVAGQFAQYGVAPRGDAGGYRQKVPLRASRLVQSSPVFELTGADGALALRYPDDFMMGGSLLQDRSEVTAPLVFVGYGIEADRFNLHDYAGLDVKDKIVVMLNGKPASLPSEEGAHFGNATLKRQTAARLGAVGVIMVPTRKSDTVSPFARGRATRFTAAMTWVGPDGRSPDEELDLQNRASISIPAAEKMFALAGVSLADIHTAAAAEQPLPHMALKLSAHLAKASERTTLQSANVIGMVEGSDPRLKHEYVVYSAHLDHLGLSSAELGDKNGDRIFNGALDNSAGVATLIEAARMVAAMPVKPKRSILFVALTAEEKGKIGSDYFAGNPTVPFGAIVANVNLDMPILLFDFKNIIALGSEHSSLGGIVARAAERIKVGIVPDPTPEQNYFTRSDQYSFIRHGIPALSIKLGTGSFNPAEDPRAIVATFLKERYHKVSDDLGQLINFDAAARFARLNYMIGVEIANAPQRPSWNAGDFFGDVFNKPVTK